MHDGAMTELGSKMGLEGKELQEFVREYAAGYREGRKAKITRAAGYGARYEEN